MDDCKGIKNNEVDGIIFITNQELKESERKKLSKGVNDSIIYHLERLASILDRPICYGTRHDYLDISMNKAEEVSFFAYSKEETNKAISAYFKQQSSKLKVPIKKLEKYRAILTKIVGSRNKLLNTLSLDLDAPLIDGLQNIPVDDLKKFETILTRIAGPRTNSLFSTRYITLYSPHDFPINRLVVPLEAIEKYEKTLDRVLEKQKQIAVSNLFQNHQSATR